MKRSFVILSALCAALSACGGSSTPPSVPANEVYIVSDSASGHFEPPTLSVAVGTTVLFTNKSQYPHNVIFADEKIDSSDLVGTDKTFSTKFSSPGTYTYVCTLHPGMKGTVVVN